MKSFMKAMFALTAGLATCATSARPAHANLTGTVTSIPVTVTPGVNGAPTRSDIAVNYSVTNTGLENTVQMKSTLGYQYPQSVYIIASPGPKDTIAAARTTTTDSLLYSAYTTTGNYVVTAKLDEKQFTTNVLDNATVSYSVP